MNHHEKRLMYAEYLEKTLGLICCQLLFTFGSALFIALCDSVRILFQSFAVPILIIGFIGSFSTVIFMNNTRKMMTYQLIIFTIFETMVICTFCSMFDNDIVIISVFTTLGLSLGLALYGFTMKHIPRADTWSILFGWSVCLLTANMCNLFIKISFLHTIGLSLGTIVFMSYIIYDVNHYLHMDSLEICSVEPYGDMHIRAAIQIYLDIMNLFVRIIEFVDMIKKIKRSN